jgi:hypothetical protein
VFVARVDGDIDKASAPKLSTSLHLLLERPDCEVLIADLSGVSSMSEEGLRILEQVVGRRVVDRNGGSADCRPAHAYGPAWRVERPPEGRAGPGGRRIRTQIRAAVTSP